MARSSYAILPLGPPSTTRPEAWRTIASLDDATSAPRVVRVLMLSTDPTFADDIMREQRSGRLAAGVWWNREAGMPAVWTGGGALRFRFGSGVQRTIYADLAAGEYQLPPCRSVTVDAALWNPDPDNSAQRPPELRVMGEIEDGVVSEPTPLWLTAMRMVGVAPVEEGGVATTSGASCYTPPGAYAVEAVPPADVPVWISAGEERAYRDFAGRAWLPPTTPIPVGAGSGVSVVQVWSDVATQDWRATLRFWLR